MNKQSNNNFNNPVDVGLPKVGYTPMDTAEMEGAMFRSMGNKNSKRPLIIRILIILLILLIFIFPAIFIFYLNISDLLIKPENVFSLTTIGMLLFSLLIFIIGVRLIYPNIKK